MKPIAPGRCLLVTDAVPARSGAADWRRFRALVEHYRMSGYEVDGLVISDKLIGSSAMGRLREAVEHGALSNHMGAAMAARRLVERGHHDVVHVGGALLGSALGQIPGHAVRVLDMLEPPSAAAARLGVSMTGAGETAIFAHADIVVAANAEGVAYAEQRGCTSLVAPFVRQADRLRRPPVRGGRFLAGLWVEKAPAATNAVNAFFDAVRARGGGGAPNFAIAGPGARDIKTPLLPHPVSVMPDDIDERVFYRGLDILMAPDLIGGAPRLDILSALEMGATPLASSAALTGFLGRWRLPHFHDLASMSEYVFEEGRRMREGGLLTELRARADWTWTSLTNTAAQDRARLNKQITSRLRAKQKEPIS